MTYRRQRRLWVFPALGFAAAAVAAAAPGSPVGPGRWGVGGPFGAFTWSAWFVSTALATTTALLAVAARALPARPTAGARPGGRLAALAVRYGLLALGSYAAAARADWIERHPLPALAVAVFGILAARALLIRGVPRRGGDVDS